jgi:hypothetical protein
MDIVAWNISNSSYNKLKQLLFFLDPRLASILKMPETSMVRWTSMYQWVSFQLHCCTIETVVCSCGEHHDVLHLSSEMLCVHIMPVTMLYLFNNFLIHWSWLVLKLWHWIGKTNMVSWMIDMLSQTLICVKGSSVHTSPTCFSYLNSLILHLSFFYLLENVLCWWLYFMNYDIDITVCIHCLQGVEEAVERRGAVT